MKNEKLWNRDSQGNLAFYTKYDISRKRKKPDVFWNHQMAMIIILISCAAIDFLNFKQLFDSFLMDAPFTRWTSIFGMLFAFDVIPIYLGLNLRKRVQGYNVNRAVLLSMIMIFLLALAANVYIRIVFKDMALFDITKLSTSIFEKADNVSGVSKYSLQYSIFASIIPLLTSIGSFTISFLITDPLKEEKLMLEEEHNKLADSISQVEAVLREYEADPNFYERITSDDNAKYEIHRQMINEKKDYFRAYVRQRIMERPTMDATAKNILSRPL